MLDQIRSHLLRMLRDVDHLVRLSGDRRCPRAVNPTATTARVAALDACCQNLGHTARQRKTSSSVATSRLTGLRKLGYPVIDGSRMADGLGRSHELTRAQALTIDAKAHRTEWDTHCGRQTREGEHTCTTRPMPPMTTHPRPMT
jgi:hypothetical protein